MHRSLKPAVLLALLAGVALNFQTTATAQTTPPPPPPPKWESSVALGATITGGNTKTILVTGNFQSQLKAPPNEYLFSGDAAYGKDNTSGTTIKSAETLHGAAQYNRLVTDRLYFGLHLDAIHDAVAGVNYRYTVAPLIGYYFIKSTNTSLNTEIGPAYVYQRRSGETVKGYATLRLAERLEHKFNDSAKMWESVEILPRVERFTDYYVNSEIGLDTAISKHTSFTTYVQDTYYNVPTAGRLKNDVKLVSGIKYKF